MLVEEFPHGFADRKLKFQQRNDITLSHCTFVVASRGVSGPHLGRRGKVFIENQTHHPAKLLFPISKLRGSYTHATPMTQWGLALATRCWDDDAVLVEDELLLKGQSSDLWQKIYACLAISQNPALIECVTIYDQPLQLQMMIYFTILSPAFLYPKPPPTGMSSKQPQRLP